MFERIKSPQHMYTAVHLYIAYYYYTIGTYAILILKNV